MRRAALRATLCMGKYRASLAGPICLIHLGSVGLAAPDAESLRRAGSGGREAGKASQALGEKRWDRYSSLCASYQQPVTTASSFRTELLSVPFRAEDAASGIRGLTGD